MLRMGIVGGYLAPVFNQYYANQMRELSRYLKAQVVTFDDIGMRPFLMFDRYRVVNIKFLLKDIPLLSTINGIFLYMALKYYQTKFDAMIVPLSIERMEFIEYLKLKKCFPLLTNVPDNAEEKVYHFLNMASKFMGIIVHSHHVLRRLEKLGIDRENLFVMYPHVNSGIYRYSEPPDRKVFKILFASAPAVIEKDVNNYDAKGVSILLESFRSLSQSYNVYLHVTWRNKYLGRLLSQVKDLEINRKVNILNKTINMPAVYKRIHITIIPYVKKWRSPEIPLSALESISVGRPVVTTDVIELADIVETYKCGVVAEANSESLKDAIEDCIYKYDYYQRNTKIANKKLSETKGFEKLTEWLLQKLSSVR